MRTVDVILPEKWEKLSQKQLSVVFDLLAQNLTVEQTRAYAFIMLAGFRILGHDDRGNYLVRKSGKGIRMKAFTVSALQIAEAAMSLDFINEIPGSPVRLSSIGGRKALDANFYGVTLESYIKCDNYYQGVIARPDKKDGLLDNMARILYPGGKGKAMTLTDGQRMNVLYWWVALKDMFAKRFPNLFSAGNSEQSNLLGDFRSMRDKLTDNVNTMVRALTKGDVTKNAEIYKTDVWTAFAELDAQTKEYFEMSRKYGKK